MPEVRPAVGAGSEQDTPRAGSGASVSSAQAPGGAARADDIDRAVQSAIADGYFPSAVVYVSRAGQPVKLAAYGYARLYQDLKTKVSDPIAARTDTVYDLASLSKLFTATCVMQLVDAGRIGLDRAVVEYIPAFAQNGKERVTVRQLLDHSSGLPEGLPLSKVPGGRAERLAAVDAVKPESPPGERFVYGDLNYIVLGQLVEVVSGQRLDAYASEHVFGPLGLAATAYNPPDPWRPRIAATEYEPVPGRGMVWGVVHDDNSLALGGVAGHAGVFSTARDVARLGELMLDGGTLGGARVLSPESVRAMTTPAPGGSRFGLGWELSQAWYMGPLASPRGWGHTGYTGTTIVVEASRRLVVVLLTNRVHPTSRGPSLNPVRQAVAAAALRA
jgi:CubicO group peptidase (beta-lactamase class C family)